MKLLTGGKDISELVECITWSGDTKQIARKVNFTIVKNPNDSNFPQVTISEGDEVFMQMEDGTIIFGGIVFDIDRTASSHTVSYLAYDLMFYINGSDISRVFQTTPEEITKAICSELEIVCGSIAATGISVYLPCLGESAYKAIMMAYTYASRQNGKKYIPAMTNVNQLSVIEKGQLSGAILTGDYNLTDANYKVSLQGLVNKILIVDEKGNKVTEVVDAESQLKYGTIQKVYKQEKGKDAATEAANMFNGVDASASVAASPSDYRAVSGYSIIIQEPDTGLYGKFYIESDSHTFANGKTEMQLTLAFENLMDEQEIKSETTEAKG